jgi:DNA-binding XRE family transcriptional regulator
MKHYVYTLAYPDGRVFYVGKGTGRRIDAHELEAKRGAYWNKRKVEAIKQIWAAGGEVVKSKVAYFESHFEAVEHERALIASLPGLLNGSAGGEGCMGGRRRYQRVSPVARSAGDGVVDPARLKSIRRNLGVAQESMAHWADVTLATYRKAEYGRNVTYTTATAILLAVNSVLVEVGREPMSLEDLGLSIV